nr:hypothetical protein [Mucilaginibacter sp. SP1R1]
MMPFFNVIKNRYGIFFMLIRTIDVAHFTISEFIFHLQLLPQWMSVMYAIVLDSI